MRYLVRDAQGNELTVPSLETLHALYDQGFLGDDDLVRKVSSERWVRAGSMPALHGARRRKRDPRVVMAILFAAVALAAAIALLLAARAR